MARPSVRNEVLAPVQHPYRVVADGDPDDDAWVRRIQHGDSHAFEALFGAYYQGLCAFAYTQLRSRAAAEELVQDLFARLWERRAEWRVQTGLRAYLFGAVRHRVVNARRDAATVESWQRSAADHRVPTGMSQPPRAADEGVQHAELTDALERSIACLPDRQRQIVWLRLRHHLTNAEVAAVCGLTERAVEKNLNRAFKTLRVALQGFI